MSWLASVVLASTFAIPSPASAQEYIFWGEYTSGRIRRANIDGTGVTTIATGEDENWTVAVDPVNQRVYWAPYGFKVAGSDFDGGNYAVVQTLSARGEGVAVDPLTSNVYFNYFTPSGSSGSLGNGIAYAAADGSEASGGGHHVYDDPPISADTALAIDWNAGTIYEGRAGAIYRAPLDGSGSLTAMPTVITSYVHGMTLDLEHGRIYWAASNSIFSANLNDTGTTTTIVSGLFGNHGMAYNPYNDTIYFVQDGDGGSSPAGVYTVPITGGTPSLLINIGGSTLYARGLAIFVPEPASLGLLALGGVMMLRRRRRA